MAVVPQKLTNEYADNGVAGAATEVINGVTYEVIYLDGNNTANFAKVAKCNENKSGNYRYVMTADWDIPAASGVLNLYGHAVIFDLNGYTFSVSGWIANQTHSSVDVRCDKLEVTDSSPTQGGMATSPNNVFVPWQTNVRELIISGGTIKGDIAVKEPGITVIFNGGTFPTSGRPLINYGKNATSENITIWVAPYMIATYNASGSLTSVKPRYEHYAVSTTPLASGVYNYAYGYKWDINATQLAHLAIPADRTYYLWARNQDGWYQYLNIVYRDGAWRNAA